MRNPLYTILAVAVLVLSILTAGMAAVFFGFIHGESPCILCWDQRIGMAIIALIGLFVLRYGPKPFYLGLAVLVGLWGTYMGLRHSSLHLARDIGQGFAFEILGAHTYIWSYFIFFCCTAAIAALIMMARPTDFTPGPPRPVRGLDRLAFIVFLMVIAANIVQAFASTGPPPFVGQADPVRFSFNPRRWIWSLDELKPTAAPISMRGRWAVPKPDVTAPDPDPGKGPLRALPPLAVASTRRLNLPLRGTPTGLDYDASSNRFLITTQHGVHITDGSLEHVVRYTVVDPMYSVDLGRFAGAAFLDSRTVIAVTENKSFVLLQESGRVVGPSGSDAAKDLNFRYFLESFGDFNEVSRSRFATVRARMNYVMSAAYDPATRSMFTITVPNRTTPRLIVSRFDMNDRLLSEEFVPAFAPGVPFAPAEGAPGLERLYVTAATIADGHLYALSAAHATLLAIDLASRGVTDARTIPGLVRPTGMALKNGQLHIVSADGTMTVVARP